MARARTGTLVPPGADGIWRARVTKTKADGTTWRPLYSLGTTDKALAKRKLARVNELLARGIDPFDAAEAAGAPERVGEFADAWFAKRTAQGVGMAKKEWGDLQTYALDAIGRLPLCDVRPAHVRRILDDVVELGRSRATVRHVRGALRRLFAAAVSDELIEHNPVDAVRMPRMREVQKERVILSDEEFAIFIACPVVDLELRMLALVARCEGGMRTGDLHRWDWTMIDRARFAECFIPRAKTGRPQALAIPPVLAPFLRAWWERAGKPTGGPVFPVRAGKRAGEEKKPLNSYAKRLRRELFVAGVMRADPIDVPATGRGVRSDLGRKALGTKLAPNPHDPLYFETAVSLPVDFHSFRRAFNTALAEAGVNVQHAMHLAAHSDPKTHMRYVMNTAAMRNVPEAALPRLSVTALVVRERDVSSTKTGPIDPPIVTSCDDLSVRPRRFARAAIATARASEETLAPTAGLEPATRRLTAACSTN